MILEMSLDRSSNSLIKDASVFVTNDEAAFAQELYVNDKEIRTMHDSGMCIGILRDFIHFISCR